jgi:membrane protein DedA with SNARE-associated domain
MLALAAIIGISNSWGYLLPAVIGLESMGIPSPGETALVAAAVLASQGKLNIAIVILIGVASAIVGDNIGYLLGRKFGRDALEAPGPFYNRRLLLVIEGDKFFKRHGGKAVLLARWVALVRVAAAWLAGINHMPFRRFFPWNAIGGITWGVTYGLVGYFGGKAAAHVLAEAGIVGAVLLGVSVVVGLVMLRRRERRVLEEHARESAAAGESSGGGAESSGGGAESSTGSRDGAGAAAGTVAPAEDSD